MFIGEKGLRKQQQKRVPACMWSLSSVAASAIAEPERRARTSSTRGRSFLQVNTYAKLAWIRGHSPPLIGPGKDHVTLTAAFSLAAVFWNNLTHPLLRKELLFALLFLPKKQNTTEGSFSTGNPGHSQTDVAFLLIFRVILGLERMFGYQGQFLTESLSSATVRECMKLILPMQWFAKTENKILYTNSYVFFKSRFL